MMNWSAGTPSLVSVVAMTLHRHPVLVGGPPHRLHQTTHRYTTSNYWTVVVVNSQRLKYYE